MRHQKYFADQGYSQAYKAMVNKLSRRQIDQLLMRPWQQWKSVSGDNLAYRQLIKSREGWQTLVNCIRNQHGLTNKY